MVDQVNVPILWHLRLVVIPTDKDGEARVQVFLDSKLKFETVAEKVRAVSEAVAYVQENFCLVPQEEASKWISQDECSKLTGSLSPNGNAS